MATLTFVALILLILTGYSAGATARAGKKRIADPKITDILFIIGLWSAAVYFQFSSGVDRWKLFLIGIGAGFLCGFILCWLHIGKRRMAAFEEAEAEKDQPFERRSVRDRWKDFLRKMGGFQSRVFFSLLYFLLITPFALAGKAFLDPLNIKKRSAQEGSLSSHWQDKTDILQNQEDFKRQY